MLFNSQYPNYLSAQICEACYIHQAFSLKEEKKKQKLPTLKLLKLKVLRTPTSNEDGLTVSNNKTIAPLYMKEN